MTTLRCDGCGTLANPWCAKAGDKANHYSVQIQGVCAGTWREVTEEKPAEAEAEIRCSKAKKGQERAVELTYDPIGRPDLFFNPPRSTERGVCAGTWREVTEEKPPTQEPQPGELMRLRDELGKHEVELSRLVTENLELRAANAKLAAEVERLKRAGVDARRAAIRKLWP